MQGRFRVVFALKKYIYDSFLVCFVLASVLSRGFFIFFFSSVVCYCESMYIC